MRNLILSISILCLALSGFITFRALNLPEKKPRNLTIQPSLKTHQSAQIAKDTVPEPARKQDPESNVNQTLQNTTAQLEQKLADKIADSQENIQTLENTVKQLEQKLTNKIVDSQTDSQATERTTAQLEQKLADRITDSQMHIQALEDTVKQLEQKLVAKIADSQTDTQPANNTITQPKQKTASHKNTSQNISKIGKPENIEKSSGLLLFEASFSSGKFVINDKITKLIQQSTQYILSLPHGYHVIVEGHTDNSPIKNISGIKYPYKDNMGLSLFRAKTVASVLEKEGISSKRISAIGYGATRPIATNKNFEGRAKNRRVVVKLIPEDKER